MALIICQDAYEAQKLASLAFPREDGGAFITSIINIIDNELVVALKDKSAHSILLRDAGQAEAFADFMQSVAEKKHRITGAAASGDGVRLEKS